MHTSNVAVPPDNREAWIVSPAICRARRCRCRALDPPSPTSRATHGTPPRPPKPSLRRWHATAVRCRWG